MSDTVYMRAEAAPGDFEAEFCGEATIEAAGEESQARKFQMVAYTGGPMRPNLKPPLPHPVIVDLAGLDMTTQRRPALKDHDPKQLVGHTERIESDGRQLTATGVVSGAGDAAREVVESSANGFVWQASMGADLRRIEFLPAGKTAQVNGRNVSGPVYIARASRLKEISFLTMGADDETAAKIAAEAAEGQVMTFEAWLKANGFQPETLSDVQKVKLQAAYNAEQGEETEETEEVAVEATDSTVTELRSEIADMRREVEVRALCGAHADVCEKAIKGKWTNDVISLAIEAAEMKAAMPKNVMIQTGRAKDAPDAGLVMEAAVATATGLESTEKDFDANTLTEAHRQYRGRIGLQQLLLEAACANGYQGRPFGAIHNDLRGVMQAAFAPVSMQASGFSTMTVTGIFANTANKFLLAGFEGVESVWRQITAVRSVRDFKTVTSYRLTGAFQFQQVGPDGQLKHGSTDEESFTNQADTYGIMYAITRKDIINDDLGALSAVPRRIGRGAALKVNDVFWTAFTGISFTGDHLSASSALGINGLTSVETKFLDKTDPDGKPLSIMPKTLLVPNALKTVAQQLMSSLEIRDTTASTKAPIGNPHAGKYGVLASSYLGNASYGNSTTTYYLLADPGDVAVIETAFLNGKESPTVEQADADFNTLGVQMRGYFDFGVNSQDVRGGVKATA